MLFSQLRLMYLLSALTVSCSRQEAQSKAWQVLLFHAETALISPSKQLCPGVGLPWHVPRHMLGSYCHGMQLHESSFFPSGNAGGDDWVFLGVPVINA